MKWSEICQCYPDEWVIVVHYKDAGPVEVDGQVVSHDPDREGVQEAVVKAMQDYGKVAVRYTGELIQESELPLLWQISHTN